MATNSNTSARVTVRLSDRDRIQGIEQLVDEDEVFANDSELVREGIDRVLDDHNTDIVDALSAATGYFHDDDAERLRDIATASGQKPVGVVKAGVEREIERREWRCVYFDQDEDREYQPANPFQYYRAHRAFQLEYEAAFDALPTEQSGLRDVQQFEHAAETLEQKARRHEAKADQAEQYLREHGHEVPEVSLDG